MHKLSNNALENGGAKCSLKFCSRNMGVSINHVVNFCDIFYPLPLRRLLCINIVIWLTLTLPCTHGLWITHVLARFSYTKVTDSDRQKDTNLFTIYGPFHLLECMAVIITILQAFGAIHKPRGQIFGYFDSLAPFMETSDK